VIGRDFSGFVTAPIVASSGEGRLLIMVYYVRKALLTTKIGGQGRRRNARFD